MLPAGVDTNTPSETNFFIINWLRFFIDKFAACLLCLKIETSLIAKDLIFLFFCLTIGKIARYLIIYLYLI